MKYDPIKELNNEVERAFWLPLILPFAIPVAIIIAIPIVLHFADAVDAYANANPTIIPVWGWSLLAIGLIGWYFFGRHNRMW